MPKIPTPEYAAQRGEQINSAIDARNGELLTGIIELVRSDGYPEFADLLTRELIEQGLRNLVAAAR